MTKSNLKKRVGCPTLSRPLGRLRAGNANLHFPKLISETYSGCPILNRLSGRFRVGCKSLLLATLFLSVLPLSAQQLTTHDLAQRVDHHYNNLKALKAQFTESYEGLGRTRTESGTLLLQKPGRMRWDYSHPAGKLFLLDGKYAWFYSKGDPQVQRIEAKKLDDLRSPLRFLLGHTQLEKEIDHLAALPAANGAFTLTGIPHKQEQRIQRLTLTVTPEGTITDIEIQETDGAITRFTFSGEQPNPPIPSSTFRFTQPAGIPVVNAMGPV
jgi:outer membrane lipoprotein carrier protein